MNTRFLYRFLAGIVLLASIMLSGTQYAAVKARTNARLLPISERASVFATFATGDVFAAISDGKVNWYRPDGALVTTLDTGLGGFTTGMAFDTDNNLYVTNFGAGTVSRFDSSGNFLGTFGSSYSASPESIVFDTQGNVYVGHADGDRDIRKFDKSGTLLAQYDVETEDRGSDWIDLAADQCTMFYTSEGTHVKRFNVCTNAQLPDFASGLHGAAYALRILSDGSVLVADTVDIHLLNSSGTIIQTYDAPGEDSWFALNLDPDGTSFWSGNYDTGNFYRFDIATGAIRFGPVSTCGSGCLYGIAIFKESMVSTLKLRLPFDLASSTSKVDGTDRINAYFDHEYPLQRPEYGGTEPQTPGIGDTIFLYTGDEVPDCWKHPADPGCNYYSGHDAYDFSGIEGKTAVYAAHQGYAAGTQWSCPGGSPINVVTITEGRYRTVYLHLHGDSHWQDLRDHPRSVQAGDRIGTVGNSGAPKCSTGPHLHFSVYYDTDDDGEFESTEKVDPYGFDPAKSDPWVAYGGPPSTWMWEFNRAAQANLIPGYSFALASGNANVYVPGNAVAEPALLALMAAPEPSSSLTYGADQARSVFAVTNIGIGSTFQLTGVYSDGTPLMTFATPVTLTFGYSGLNLTYVSEGTLCLYQWEQASSTWIPLPTVLDTVAKQATATTDRPGLFSLRAQPLYPAPVLIAVSPSSASNSGQTIITVTGVNFMPTPWLELDTTALDVGYVSSSTLSAVVPSGLIPGTYTLILRNPDGQTATLANAFTVSTPPTGMVITGPATGVVQTEYIFTATVSPITATQPFTYVWQATGQSPVTHANVMTVTDVTTFTWNMPGPKTLTVTATNVGGTVTGTHVITIRAPLTTVDVSGPTAGVVHTGYTFTAAAGPVTATLPITYVWQATGQSPVTHANVMTVTDATTFTWNMGGAKVITITATNAVNAVFDTHVITIRYRLYLPLVMRNY